MGARRATRSGKLEGNGVALWTSRVLEAVVEVFLAGSTAVAAVAAVAGRRGHQLSHQLSHPGHLVLSAVDAISGTLCVEYRPPLTGPSMISVRTRLMNVFPITVRVKRMEHSAGVSDLALKSSVRKKSVNLIRVSQESRVR
jgi:hypothetical protein